MKKPLIIHPFLFAIFPVLFVFSHNLTDILQSEIYFPALTMIILAAAFFLLFSVLLVRDYRKAAILVSAWLVPFFSYGHFFNFIAKATIVEHSIALVIFITLYSMVACLVIRTQKSLSGVTQLLNFIALCLVIMQLAKIVSSTVFLKYKIATKEDVVAGCPGKSGPAPDIYYIVLDGYGRQDMLQEIYGVDNSDFISYLIKKGFFVADKSFANYPSTGFSLASSLNLEYLDRVIGKMNPESTDEMPILQVLRKNRVFSFLKKHGYRVVVVASGYTMTEIKDSDVDLCIDFGANTHKVMAEVLASTPLPLFFSLPIYRAEYKLHRERILKTFEYLSHGYKTASPFFIFAHIFCPHPPFIFGPNGEELDQDTVFTMGDGPHLIQQGRFTRQQYIKQYRDQLEFITQKTKAMLEAILTKPGRPCVIILQSDHGPASQLDWDNPNNTAIRERMGILNAYYFFNRSFDGLYEGLSPVNSFRLVFNRFFCANYDILADKSYFASFGQRYKYIDVTQEIK